MVNNKLQFNDRILAIAYRYKGGSILAGAEALLHAAYILMLPSPGENLPTSAVEARTHNATVTCTLIGARRGTIGHERTGLKSGDVQETRFWPSLRRLQT